MTLLSTVLVFVALQSVQQPAKASIDGFVVRAGTNEPLARARITVSRSAGGTEASVQPLQTGPIPSVTTDSHGHFTINNLEPGSYSLVAQRNGFARQSYGA